MKCPHCLVEFHDNPRSVVLEKDIDGGWAAVLTLCPKCTHLTVELLAGHPINDAQGRFAGVTNARKRFQVYPKGSGRPPCPREVPPALAEDYNEACLVLSDSPKASAALSRRCLQHLLREAAKVKPSDLYNEIQEVLDSGKLRPDIAEGLDAVRAIGNFAAHPIKSKVTGEIIPVEPGEAEWNLDVLEALFDFYYVQPAVLKAKKDALNKKLAEAAKPPIK
jgi:hypothetical protein